MMDDPPVAFPSPPERPPAIQIRINFGILTGRDATPAEIDELARLLTGIVEGVSIVSEQRYEATAGHEAMVHQVRVDVDERLLPDDEAELERVSRRLVDAASRWAESCADARSAEL